MNLSSLSIAATLTAVLAVFVLRHSSSVSPSDQSHQHGTFVPIAADVFRLSYSWHIPWLGVWAPVHVLLASFGKDYVLFDAGAPGREYADFLLPRLETALGDGQLRLIALTHGHSDHVGALEALVQKYPDVQVVFHQDEAPYITGQFPYDSLPSDHDKFNVTMFDIDVSSALSEERVLHVRGSSRDVADAFRPSGCASDVGWLPPRGALHFHHAPGHAPGLVAYLHKGSGSAIVGDIVHQLGDPPVVDTSHFGFTSKLTQSTLSAKALAALDFDVAFPVHDSAAGVTKRALQDWAQQA
ncbi:hypothetical protein CVIRNUC_008370 [Coccomyxa viridis]|uniref:Metallo-beta-lactamase domain-containing protein n=1 Tax=Coccomyxa viridis TaxID=1274662 RepID=A0AAV1IGM8_9CHLO|nr:hypothetical protein CVIRNUC_008370 [Coccomyxa viridis]